MEPTVKLTPAQEKMLRRIIKTSGGGVYAGIEGRERNVIMRLYDKGLVQGKKGQPTRAVHTREGLDLIRQLDAAETPH